MGLVDTKTLKSMVPKNIRDMVSDYNGYGMIRTKVALAEVLSETNLKPVTRKIEDSEDDSSETLELFETGVGLYNEGFLFYSNDVDATCEVPW